jgi:ATP-dependent helicase HrpB
VEERGLAGRRGGGVNVRLAVGIQPEWLLDLSPEDLKESDELVWNAQTERVERVVRLAYGAVVLEETRKPAPPSPEASRLLAEAALAGDFSAADEEGGFETLGLRLGLLREAFPDAGVPPADASGLRQAVLEACEGRISLAELREADLRGAFVGRLPPAVAKLLRAETPERVRLGSGREVPVHYEADKPPWIESRLQDFFGASAGPALCRGRVPLTLHLLAPNGRAVQVTRDLAGFWRQHYPALRRELGRRYPRHPWPEDGATATPPPPKPPRR